MAIGSRAVAGDLRVNFCTARFGVLQLFEYDDAGASGDDKAVAILVIGARGGLRPVVEIGRHRAHRIEQDGERPIELLAAAGENQILLAELDRLVSLADAMVRSRAGR